MNEDQWMRTVRVEAQSCLDQAKLFQVIGDVDQSLVYSAMAYRLYRMICDHLEYGDHDPNREIMFRNTALLAMVLKCHDEAVVLIDRGLRTASPEMAIQLLELRKNAEYYRRSNKV